MSSHIPKSESWKMFNQIAKRYDLLNRLLSFGLDVRWRKQLSTYIPERPDLLYLDLATGTADVIIEIVRNHANITRAVGIDMAEGMLKLGRAKVARAMLADRISLQQEDAQKLSFASGEFDVVTIAFGIRNMPDLRQAMMEMYRVLKPGGRTIILEFSMPSNPLLVIGHIFYLRAIVPLIGFLFTGNYKAYRYLNETIEEFPYGEQFCRVIAQVGFKNIEARPLLGGVATIYVGDK